MSSDETEVRDPVGQAAAPATQSERPSWRNRDHPTFAALTGFFTGLAFVLLVPAAFVGLLSWIVDYRTAEDLFPLVLVTLAVPLVLVVNPRTRRFGTYMWIGVVSTAVVVLGVAAVVLYVLVNGES